VGDREYPEYLREKGFRFVERQPGTDKIPIRQASSNSTVPEDMRMSSGQFGNMVHNKRNLLRLATPDQMERGRLWYPTANRIAETIHPDIEKSAGVIAALSGNGTEWGQNVRSAEQFLKTGVPASTNTAKQIEDATRIAEGEHYSTVLPKGLKTRSFADTIVDPYNETSYVVDTHDADSSAGLKMPWKTADRGLGAIGRYNTFADAGRSAATKEGIIPNHMQAATWLAWKEMGHPTRGNPRAVDLRARGRRR
jgi:hypothetical protein